jgi:ATP-dependent Clp protease ATP-binding subunit ClpA
MQHAELTPLHLLSALVADEDGITRSIINRADGDANQASELTMAGLHRMPTVSGAQPQTSPAILKVLNDALQSAKSMGDYEAGDTINVEYSGDELTFAKVRGTPATA